MLLDTDDLSEISKTIEFTRKIEQALKLVPAEVTVVKPVAMGEQGLHRYVLTYVHWRGM